MRALFVFTPSESKRLIGRAVAKLDEVTTALERGNILIAHGSTNVYVAEEILGRQKLAGLMDRNLYVSGLTVRGTLCSTAAQRKPPILVLRRGEVTPPAATMSEMLRDFGRESVVVKGANAVDPQGNAAVMMAHPEGGMVGWSIGAVVARGIHLVVPVGLEKLVPSVPQAVRLCGQDTLDYSQGQKVGLMPLVGATVVTEIEALEILAGVECVHIASGGTSGSEGSVTLIVEGDRTCVEKAITIAEAIKGEPALAPPKDSCTECAAERIAPGGTPSHLRQQCPFASVAEDELPLYLRTDRASRAS